MPGGVIRCSAAAPTAQSVEHGFEPARRQFLVDEEIGQPRDAQPRAQRRQHRVATVGADRSVDPHRRFLAAGAAEAPDVGVGGVGVGEAGMGREIGGVARAAMRVEIGGRRDDMAGDRAQPPRAQRRVGQFGDAERDVDPFADDVDERVRQPQVDLDPRDAAP